MQVTVTEEKNGEKVKREKDVFDPFRLKIPVDTRAMSAYENGGMMTQVNKNGEFSKYVLGRSTYQGVICVPIRPVCLVDARVEVK